MNVTVTPAMTGHRPAAVWTALGMLGFLGITAVGGGLALVLGVAAPPTDWLDRIPVVDSWTVPGLVLAVGFGLGSLVTAYGVLRRPGWPWLDAVQRLTRHHWSWLATLVLVSVRSPGSPWS